MGDFEEIISNTTGFEVKIGTTLLKRNGTLKIMKTNRNINC
jgi:hypothetical protein